MSQPQPPSTPGQPEPVEEPTRKRRRWPWIVGIVLAASIGYGAGSSGGTTEPAATITPPVPAETVTAEAEVVTETETVVEVPQSCLDALMFGEQGFTVAADFAQASSDGFYAAAEMDIAGLQDAQARIEQATADLEPIGELWNAAKAECRTAAGQ